MKKINEEIDLVSSLKKGDRLAFKFFFENYYGRLVAYITTYTHNKIQSEDIVQQAFISFWEEKEKLDATKSPRSYLYAIAYNRYIDTIKKAKRQEKFLDIVWERALRERITEDNDLFEKRIAKMNSIIETLPPKCKEIIMLNKVQGVKYNEIAERMDISIKTVESQMRIAFRKIREGFKNENLYLFFIRNVLFKN